MDTKKLNNELLKRVDNESLTTWKTFFRNSFPTDEACLEFLYRAISAEPIINISDYEQKDDSNIFIDKNGNSFCDDIFNPRRMLNTVNRLVSVASDIEKIRPGKDIFKIIFLVTCVETLQQLSGKTESKKELLFNFFKTYTSEEDKDFIRNNFKCDETPTKDTFMQFIEILNEYRNCAVHEGKYFDYIFNQGENDSWQIVSLSRKKKDYGFETRISYHKFEQIFICCCIKFINRYIKLSEYNAIRKLTKISST